MSFSPSALEFDAQAIALMQKLAAIGELLINPAKTLFVAPNFPDANPRFTTPSQAVTQAQGMTRSAASPVTIISYSPSSAWSGHNLETLAADDIIVVVLSNIQAGGGGAMSPAKIYKAVISQSGTNAPALTISETVINLLGTTATLSRVGTGHFRLTAGSGVFTQGKTFPLFGYGTNSGPARRVKQCLRNSATQIEWQMVDESNSLADGFLNSVLIIEVYD